MFEDSQFEYVQNHLRIISAFMVVKPRDGVISYRFGNAGEGWNRETKICMSTGRFIIPLSD